MDHPNDAPKSPYIGETEFHRAHALRFREIEAQETDDAAAVSRARRVAALIDGTTDDLDEPADAITLHTVEALAATWALLANAHHATIIVFDRDEIAWGITTHGRQLVARGPGQQSLELRDLITEHGPVRMTEWFGYAVNYHQIPPVDPAVELAAQAQALLRLDGITATAQTHHWNDGTTIAVWNEADTTMPEWTRSAAAALRRHGIPAKVRAEENQDDVIIALPEPTRVPVAQPTTTRIDTPEQLHAVSDESAVWNTDATLVGQVTNWTDGTATETTINWADGTVEDFSDVDLPVHLIARPNFDEDR